MPKVIFSGIFRRHMPAPSRDVSAATVRAALLVVFDDQPRLRGYVFDDQGALRRHVQIYVRDRTIADRARQSDAVAPDDEIYVMQALSGG